jgi:hypothetical protein
MEFNAIHATESVCLYGSTAFCWTLVVFEFLDLLHSR